MTHTHTISAHLLLRGSSSGGAVSSPCLVAAHLSALPGFSSLLTRHKLSPASVGEPFHPNPPRRAADPWTPDASAPEAKAGGFVKSRAPFVGDDCLFKAPALSCSGVGASNSGELHAA